MANAWAFGQQILQNQNLNIPHEGPPLDGRTKSSKAAKKKGGGLGSRKALNDITNSSSLHQGVAPKKKNTIKEIDIAEEMFLHDHRKCIEAQIAAKEQYLFDPILLEDDLIPPFISPKSEQAEVDFESPPCYLELEPEPELPISEMPAWLESLFQWDSPPSSPIWFEPQSPNFVLKPDIDDVLMDDM